MHVEGNEKNSIKTALYVWRKRLESIDAVGGHLQHNLTVTVTVNMFTGCLSPGWFPGGGCYSHQ